MLIYLLWAPYPLKPSLKSPGWKSVESSTSPSSMPPFPVIQANAEKRKKNIVLHIKTKLTYKKPKGFLKLFWNYPLLPNVDGMSC